MKHKLAAVYRHCLKEIGGRTNGDVKYLLEAKKKGAVRKTFFAEAVGAILGSGINRKAADTFSRRATACGFEWDFQRLTAWSKTHWNRFFKALYSTPRISGRRQQKWNAIRHVAEKLAAFANEASFQTEFFAAKTKSKDLDKDDVRRLLKTRLPFIGYANAQFIVRNMGGETMKCDRWIKEMLTCFNLTEAEVEKQLKGARISLSLFDIAVWGYCEKCVKKVKFFKRHFDQLLTAGTTST
jgi:hypothetical protein